MSSKLIKQALHQAYALDEVSANKLDAKSLVKTKPTTGSAKPESQHVEKGTLESSVNSLLFYDKAFSDRSDSNKIALHRRLKVTGKKKPTKVQVPIGNSRCSSSIFARKAHIPTFNKRRHNPQKKVTELKELARMLKRNKK
jgi:hypothetical protein